MLKILCLIPFAELAAKPGSLVQVQQVKYVVHDIPAPTPSDEHICQELRKECPGAHPEGTLIAALEGIILKANDDLEAGMPSMRSDIEDVAGPLKASIENPRTLQQKIQEFKETETFTTTPSLQRETVSARLEQLVLICFIDDPPTFQQKKQELQEQLKEKTYAVREAGQVNLQNLVGMIEEYQTRKQGVERWHSIKSSSQNLAEFVNDMWRDLLNRKVLITEAEFFQQQAHALQQQAQDAQQQKQVRQQQQKQRAADAAKVTEVRESFQEKKAEREKGIATLKQEVESRKKEIRGLLAQVVAEKDVDKRRLLLDNVLRGKKDDLTAKQMELAKLENYSIISPLVALP